MRVAQLVETLDQGGAEKLVVEISRVRHEAGDQSHIIVLSHLGPFLDLVAPGVKVHEIGLDPSRLFSFPAALVRLDRLLAALDIEVLQTHLPRANFFGLLLCWRDRPRFFPTIHNNREFDYGDQSGSFRGWARRFAYRRMVVQSRRMIAVSPAARTAMIGELGLTGPWTDRIAVVPNGTVLPSLPTEAERTMARLEWGAGPQDVLVVGLGRLTRQKNFGDLVAVLASLSTAGLLLRCVIAGSGEEREELAASIAAHGLADRVLLPGHVKDTARLMGAADIFCIPSLWEGLPLALLEAMAAGLPVTGYAIDGVRETVEQNRAGILAAPGNREELAGHLSRLAGSRALRLEMGQAARQRIARDFSFDRMAESLGALYGA